MTHPLLTGPELGPQALCAETDPDAFFPEKGVNAEAAKAVCGRCEVRDACLQWALAQPHRLYGIWGATSETERRKLRGPITARKQQPINHGRESGERTHRRRGAARGLDPRAVSRGLALAAYLAACAASVLLWAFGKAVEGWAP